VVDPSPPEVENAILKRLGQAPFTIGNKNLNLLLAKAYAITGKAALKKAFEEASGEEAGSQQSFKLTSRIKPNLTFRNF